MSACAHALARLPQISVTAAGRSSSKVSLRGQEIELASEFNDALRLKGKQRRDESARFVSDFPNENRFGAVGMRAFEGGAVGVAAYTNFTSDVQRSKQSITSEHADSVVGILKRLHNLHKVSHCAML